MRGEVSRKRTRAGGHAKSAPMRVALRNQHAASGQDWRGFGRGVVRDNFSFRTRMAPNALYVTVMCALRSSSNRNVSEQPSIRQ